MTIICFRHNGRLIICCRLFERSVNFDSWFNIGGTRRFEVDALQCAVLSGPRCLRVDEGTEDC